MHLHMGGPPRCARAEGWAAGLCMQVGGTLDSGLGFLWGQVLQVLPQLHTSVGSC